MQHALILITMILLGACKAQTPITPTTPTLEHSMHWNGEDRTYNTYVPNNVKSDQSVPLLAIQSE